MKTTAPAQLYVAYIAVSLLLTSALAVTLFRNGKTFLHDVFDDRHEMADALNRLLVVGFFMFNAGYALLIFRGEDVRAVDRPADFAMDRIGLLLVTLAVIHFINMAVFWKIRHRAAQPAGVARSATPRPTTRPTRGPAPQTPEAPRPTDPRGPQTGWAPAPAPVQWPDTPHPGYAG